MKRTIFIFIVISFIYPSLGATQKPSVDSVMLNTMIQALESVNAKKAETAMKEGQLPDYSQDSAVAAGSLKRFREKGLIVYGDYIYVRVNNIKAILNLQKAIRKSNPKDTNGQIILYINGEPMWDITLNNIDRIHHDFIFYLNRHSIPLKQFYPYFTYINTEIPVILSIGFKNGIMLNAQNTELNMKYVTTWALWLILVLVAIIVSTFVYLAYNTNLIRIGKTKKTQFSLSLTQLLFWTIVIAASYFYIWIATQEMVALTGSTLILLGISVTTTAGSRIVDKRDKLNVDLLKKTKGFFPDIMSDEDGYSVHRSQMLLWTIIIGFIFIVNVVRDQQLPQLDMGLLGLMGISAAGYVGLKQFEKRPDKPSKNPTPPTRPAN